MSRPPKEAFDTSCGWSHLTCYWFAVLHYRCTSQSHRILPCFTLLSSIFPNRVLLAGEAAIQRRNGVKSTFQFRKVRADGGGRELHPRGLFLGQAAPVPLLLFCLRFPRESFFPERAQLLLNFFPVSYSSLHCFHSPRSREHLVKDDFTNSFQYSQVRVLISTRSCP